MNYDWVQPTIERIANLLAMPDRHNSYGTPKIDPRLAWEAVRFFWPATNPYTPMPRISPTKYGGIEFVWCGRDTDVSVVRNPDDSGEPSVHHLRGPVTGLPGGFATPFQILEQGLRQIDLELDPARAEAPKP